MISKPPFSPPYPTCPTFFFYRFSGEIPLSHPCRFQDIPTQRRSRCTTPFLIFMTTSPSLLIVEPQPLSLSHSLCIPQLPRITSSCDTVSMPLQPDVLPKLVFHAFFLRSDRGNIPALPGSITTLHPPTSSLFNRPESNLCLSSEFKPIPDRFPELRVAPF